VVLLYGGRYSIRVTASQYDVKTGEWTMSKLPVHHIIE
jgi:hypothetical protein